MGTNGTVARLWGRLVSRVGIVVVALALVASTVAALGPQVASAASFGSGDRVKVIDGTLNLREGAGTSADVIEVLADGTELNVLGGPSNANGYSWYKVETDEGTVGWAAGTYLADVASGGGGGGNFAQGDTVRVVGGALNFREAPGLDGAVQQVIEDGTAGGVTDGPVYADGYTWYEIFNFEIGRGWVAGEFLVADSGISLCEGQGPCDDPQQVGDTVRVVTDRLNVRQTPGTDASVITVLSNGATGEFTGEVGGASGLLWVEISGSFGTGWVARQYVAFE